MIIRRFLNLICDATGYRQTIRPMERTVHHAPRLYRLAITYTKQKEQ